MKYFLNISFVMLFLTSLFEGIAQNKEEVAPKGLEVGDTLQDFSLIDENDSVHSLYQALDKGPLVVIFYRGEWCPICNKHLSTIQDSSAYIFEKNAQIWAISPQKIERIEETKDKTKATFTLLFDEGYRVGKLFDVMFTPAKSEVKKYNVFLGADLKHAHDQDTLLLPVPATFVINQKGVIVWRQFDVNYRNRSYVSDIIKNL